jgi:membrane protease subunit HflC
MKGMSKISVLISAGIVVVILLSSGLFIVDETQQVIITQFGDPVGEAITTPGLKLKVPFIQTVNYFDKRFLEWDGDPNQVPTRDKRFIWVDAYARWRISNPLTYLERLRGDENTAQSRLDDILDGETRNAIARHDLLQVVRTSNRVPDTVEGDQEETGVLDEIETGRADIAADIRETAAPRLAELGLELIDFQLKRINYVAEVQQDVFARMIAERQRIAQQYRSEGEGEAARIRGERQRDLQTIQSEAYRQAQETQGVADAEASRVYADAYSRDGEFYEFTKSMESFETAIDTNTLLILTTDNELFKYINQPQ